MKAIRKISLAILYILMHSYSVQSQDIDSTKNILKNPDLDFQKCIDISIETSKEVSAIEERIFFTNKAIECAQQSKNKLLFAKTLDELSIIELDWGSTEKAERFSREALVIRKEQNDPVEYAKGLFRLGEILKAVGRYPKALDSFKESVSIFSKDSSSNKRSLAIVYNSIGDIYTKLAEYDIALFYLKNSLALREEGSFGLASAHLNLAVLYLNMGNLSSALESAQQSLNIYKSFPEEGESSARACNTIAGIFYEQNNYQKALEYYNKALEYDYFNPSLKGEIKSNMGAIWVNQKQYDKALNGYLEERTFRLEAQDKENLALVDLNLGMVYYRQEQYERAEPYYQSALSLARETGAMETKIEVVRRMADNFYFLGKADSALFYIDSLVYAVDERKGDYETATNLEMEQLTLGRRMAIFERNKAQKITLIIIILALFCISTVALLAYRERSRRRFAEKDREQKVNEALKDAEIRVSNTKINVIEAERERISRDIHDSVGAILTSTKLHFEALGKKLDNMEGNSRERYDDAFELLSKAQEETRRVVYNMATETLQQYGLAAQIKEYIKTIQDSDLFKVDLNLKGIEERFDRMLETKIYRIIQELVNNALKYSEATNLDIDIERIENHLKLSIKDNGKGFDFYSVKKGIGLNSIKDRVSDLGGKIDINSQKGNGTKVLIEDIRLN